MTDRQPSNWEFAADDVLSAVLRDETIRQRVVYELQLMPAHMPTPQHQAAYQAVITCMGNKEAIHDTTILEKCGSVVSLEWLAQRWILRDETRIAAYESNVAIVRKYGQKAGVKQMLQIAASQLDNGKTVDQVINSLVTALTGMHKSGTVQRVTAKDIAEDFAQMMSTPPPPLLKTGIGWLDGLTGGVDRGHMYWIAAPYKSRKSTVMLNMALGLLMTWVTNGCIDMPPSIGIASGEMPRQRIAAQFVAMVAVAWLRKQGLWSETFMAGSTAYPLHMISPNMLLQARGNYRLWDKRRVTAVDYGIAQWRTFDTAIRVYDRSSTGGGLMDIKQVIGVMRHDMHLHKTNVFFIDYLQIFKGAADAKLFDYVSNASLQLQQFAQSENITLVILAQQNEDAIRNGAGYSAGIKGGGDPTATADYLIASRYKSGDLTDDNQLELTMKFSRHGMGGGNVQRLFSIHPNSGLLLESEWISKLGGTS